MLFFVNIEHVRMPANQLVGGRRQRIREGKLAILGAELRDEDSLEHEVTQLVTECHGVVCIDGVDHFIGLFQHERAE